jgi:sugar lactone lactonase YvrE
MKGITCAALAAAVCVSLMAAPARAEFPNDWFTVLSGVGAIEGLTGDDFGKFYVADREANTCTIWEIDTSPGLDAPVVDDVGAVNQPGCTPSGLAFGPDGALYITTAGGGGFIYRQELGDFTPAEAYAIGVPGANGVAFAGGDLYVTDGTANQGRVWKITGANADCNPGSLFNCVEFFRIEPRRNGEDLGGNVENTDPPDGQPNGVGSARYTVPRHNLDDDPTDRQDIVANGIAFTPNGKTAYVADTARGAIWAAQLNSDGTLKSAQGCDETFHENVLCREALYVAHPLLEGVDGIALLDDGTILASVNERNSIVAIKPNKKVVEEFVNPADGTTLLRNGDPSEDPPRPMEFPTSPFVSGQTFCTTGADSPRRDNNPNGPGEGPKVTCLNQDLTPGGLSLPVQ